MIRILVFLITAATAFAEPSKVKTTYDVPVGQMVKITVATEKELGMVTSFSEEQAFFEELAVKPKSKRFVFQTQTPGVYTIAMWNVGEATGTLYTINVKGPVVPPPVVPPVTPPPVVPPVVPPVTPVTTYFYIIRPDGPASKEFSDIMSLPAWNTLAKQGFQYGAKTVTEAKTAGYQIPSPLPAVYILRIQDGKSKIDGPPIVLPATDAGILALPKGVN